MINNQILYKSASASPIIASYERFPRLEEIQNEALYLASHPYASSKYVKFLLEAMESTISEFVDKMIKSPSIDCLNVSVIFCMIEIS